MTEYALWLVALYLLAGGVVCCLNLLVPDADPYTRTIGGITRAVLFWPPLLILLGCRLLTWLGIWFVEGQE